MKKKIKKNNNKLVKKEKRSIDDPLENIDLDFKQIVGVLGKATAGSAISSMTSLVPGLNKLFEWVERFDQASREEKLKILLTKYEERFDSYDEAIDRLNLLATTRGGQTIFRKVIQIIDKGNEDQEWINLLAITLKKITDIDFEKYFDAQIFILSQIDRLSPQALILLSEYNVWKSLNIQGTTTTSGYTAGDWIPQVVKLMRREKGIDDLEIGARIGHSFHELESAGMVNLKGHQLKLTAIGLEIHRAITEE